MAKNIARYENDYACLPFEEEQAHLRRFEVLQILQELRPKRVLEVGCGRLPLFTDYRDFDEMVVVEPGDRFAVNAADLSEALPDRDRIRIEKAFLEEADLGDSHFDMVILSSLLHEVDDLEDFMRKAREIGSRDTTYLITVPNEASFHRQLGVHLGLVSEVSELSQQQTRLQQTRVFSRASLQKLLESSGLRSRESKTIIFKPLTHGQMQSILDHGILTREQMHGLCSMIGLIDSDAGSEILVVAEPS